MKKKVGIWIVISFSLTLLLVACGQKSQESVVKKLEENVESMDGYKAKAEMLMSVGQEEQKYMIDIWHKKDDFYRVELSNDNAEHESQIILKNEDGVFVLTPALNKNFKFQTEWPENSSQPYLYQSLVNDVLQDPEAEFEATESHYIFHTKTNYQNNNNLPYQEIYFDQKNFTPVLVKVLDNDKNVLVEVKFSEFELDPTFQENDFNVEENLGSDSTETLNPEVEEVEEEVESDPFQILFPLFTAGAELAEKKEVSLENGKRVIMTFTGEKNFTLVQEKLDTITTLSYPQEVTGELVNLGFTIGALSNNAVEWIHNNVEYYLASEDLTKEELIEVAQSVQGQEVK